MFHWSSLVGLAVCITATAQTFEPTDFNVTSALLDKGVNASVIAELDSSLQERSSSSSQACSAACTALSLLFGKDAVDTKDELSYGNFTGGFWAQNQAEVRPYCIFKPSKPADVSVVVLLSRLTQCPFAAKSGGHAAFAGASNIEGGITISFEKLNQIKLSSDKKIASVQPGNTWQRVYSELSKSDLSVIGGRVSHIGVGGLTTGGGISFFSNIHGLACDNVASYDVVTASGLIVTASPTQYSDLYWALRGGGNNFGLVVGFNLDTFSLPGGAMWGGSRIYTEDQFPNVLKAFSNLVANSPTDPRAGQWVAWVLSGETKVAASELWYTEPNGNKAAIFSEYNALTAIQDTTGNRNQADYTATLQSTNPNGRRETYYGLTVRADPALAVRAKDIFFEEMPKLSGVAGVNPVLIYQGITKGQIQNMAKRGGNALGINAANGPLYLIHLACWWDSAKDDALVYGTISTVLQRITDEAKSRGLNNSYIYMNYASQYEDVIRSYGADNKAKLKKIANIYDPARVFQELQPGYFKLDRAPIPNAGYFSG
ncbi:FAD binding domain-containing protein [Mariannaea sp. PMI_226]|nr:FAD binding domain-containing protein [Mariannaea sp. PMI_226]